MSRNLPTPVCTCCDRIARDIPAVVAGATFMGIMPETYVRVHDSSYDEETGEFLCDTCYAMQVDYMESVLIP